MGIKTIDHVTINTRDLDRCVAFYEDVLGFKTGPRPDIPIPGAWLYAGDQPVIHVMANPEAPEGPTGPFDHVAFRCTDFDDVKARLKEAKLEVREMALPDFKLKQLFVRDPHGVAVELNFYDE